MRHFEQINSWEVSIPSLETINHHPTSRYKYRLMTRNCIISWDHSKMLCIISWDYLSMASWDDIVSSHENIPRYYVWSREMISKINLWGVNVSSHEIIPRFVYNLVRWLIKTSHEVIFYHLMRTWQDVMYNLVRWFLKVTREIIIDRLMRSIQNTLVKFCE